MKYKQLSVDVKTHEKTIKDVEMTLVNAPPLDKGIDPIKLKALLKDKGITLSDSEIEPDK